MTERFFVSPIVTTAPGKLQARVVVQAPSPLDWHVLVEVTFDETPGMTLGAVRRLALDMARDRMSQALTVLADRPSPG